MGCGNSKLIPEGEMVPPRIRPLRSRFSELRKRKNNLRDGTLSKKVLLKDRELEEENSMLVSSSPNSSQNSLASQSQQQQQQKHPTKQDKHEDSGIPLSNNPTKAANLLEKEPTQKPHKHLTTTQGHHDDQKHNETLVELKEDKTLDEHKYIHIEEEGDDNNKKAGEVGRSDNEENRCFICPGSPSFRVYFVEETKNGIENVEMKDAGIEDVSHKKPPSHDSVESTTCAKANFGEGQENKTIKKGKKGRSFKRVISKKRPVGVGVKNLLNVKSCYHLSCSGNDRANLLA